MASLALLFTAFGICVYVYNGKPAVSGSMGLKLYEVAKYVSIISHLLSELVRLTASSFLQVKGPTVFPVLFAAIVGGSMERIASWRIQTKHGATLGMVELCLGSQTLSRAFTTQTRIRAFSLASAAILCLWALSPLGSQASLRVISMIPSLSSASTQIAI